MPKQSWLNISEKGKSDMQARQLYTSYLAGYLNQQRGEGQGLTYSGDVSYLQTRIAYIIGVLHGQSTVASYVDKSNLLHFIDPLLSDLPKDKNERDPDIRVYYAYLDALAGSLTPISHIDSDPSGVDERRNVAKIIGCHDKIIKSYTLVHSLIDSILNQKTEDISRDALPTTVSEPELETLHKS